MVKAFIISLSYIFSLYSVSHAFANSFFERDQRLDNTFVGSQVSEILTSLSADKCARACHNASTCLSFVYNQNDRSCRLLPRIDLNPEEAGFRVGNVFFRKRDEQSICEIPVSVPKGRPLYIDGQTEGSKAVYDCDDNNVSFTESGVCNKSGNWVGLDNPCQQMAAPPYEMAAVGRFIIGACLVIIATPTASTDMSIFLDETPGNINFFMHLRFIFNQIQQLCIVRNSMTNGHWTQEERHAPYWPFVVNREFNLTTCAEETGYKVFVDGTEMFTYSYQRPLSGITKIRLTDAISLRKMYFLG